MWRSARRDVLRAARGAPWPLRWRSAAWWVDGTGSAAEALRATRCRTVAPQFLPVGKKSCTNGGMRSLGAPVKTFLTRGEGARNPRARGTHVPVPPSVPPFPLRTPRFFTRFLCRIAPPLCAVSRGQTYPPPGCQLRSPACICGNTATHTPPQSPGTAA